MERREGRKREEKEEGRKRGGKEEGREKERREGKEGKGMEWGHNPTLLQCRVAIPIHIPIADNVISQ